MIANYHTHTWRCRHADGTEEEYVQNAITRGLKILGFSDHTPYIFPGDYYSTFRMRMDQLSNYTDTVDRLSQKYAGQIEIHAGQIEIHTGLECEYYPKYFPQLLEILRDRPIEYLILGQHIIGNEPEGTPSSIPTDNRNLLKAYCHQTMEAMNSGLFSCFAHPDLIHFIGDDSFYREQMRELAREAKRCHIPLEINLLGLAELRHYPDTRFLEIAAEENCPMVIGIDAHTPSALSRTDIENNARNIAASVGCNIIDTISLLPIR